MTVLFSVSAVLLVGVCVVLFSIRGRRYTVEPVAFDTSAYETDPVRIAGLLVRPRARRSERLPGLVFCPGLFANKEVYLGLCRRIANLGVAVLAIDLRGHGHSGGPSSFGRCEARDVWSAVDALGARDDVDPDRLGVMGHSLGGIAATRAGFEQSTHRIKAGVAIFCWKGFGEAVEAVFGPLERFVGRWWPFFGWSRQFSVLDPGAVGERSLIGRLGPEVGINYLLVVGSRDPLTDRKRSLEVITRAAGRTGIEPGVTYGRFSDGSARRIEIIKGANHWSVLSRRSAFRSIRQWLEECLGVEGTGEGPRSSASRGLPLVRRASLLLWALSTLTFAACTMGVLLPEHASGLTGPPHLTGPIMAAAAFLLCSAMAIPWARTIGLKPFVPHWGADIVSLVETSRALLFVPALALIVVPGAGGQRFPIDALGLAPPLLCPGIVAAALLFLWILCSWNMVARANRFTTLWPVVEVRSFLLLLGSLFVCYLAEETLFRGMIQRQLSGLGAAWEVLLSALLYSAVASVGMTAALLPLFPSISYAARFRSRSVPLLPVVLVFALAVFFLHGLAAAFLYHFTGTIVAPALFLALLVSFLFTGPIGIRTY